ncbi:MAG: hypothetical protein TU36_002640 [Vulcanisaeta sp. AZ3]|nr:MAG: hypothetical protein TU36_01640 [Vulcanisaeta sp. AZ3]
MTLIDSLVFPDMVATIILLVIILILIMYLTSLLIEISIIDYKASMATYLFARCQLGTITINGLNHVTVITGNFSRNYLIICPKIAVNNSQTSVIVYTAYIK